MRYTTILCCSIIFSSACVLNVEENSHQEAADTDNNNAIANPSWREGGKISPDDCRSFYRRFLPGQVMEVPVECHPFVIDPYSQISNPSTSEEVFENEAKQK